MALPKIKSPGEIWVTAQGKCLFVGAQNDEATYGIKKVFSGQIPVSMEIIFPQNNYPPRLIQPDGVAAGFKYGKLRIMVHVNIPITFPYDDKEYTVTGEPSDVHLTLVLPFHR